MFQLFVCIHGKASGRYGNLAATLYRFFQVIPDDICDIVKYFHHKLSLSNRYSLSIFAQLMFWYGYTIEATPIQTIIIHYPSPENNSSFPKVPRNFAITDRKGRN